MLFARRRVVAVLSLVALVGVGLAGAPGTQAQEAGDDPLGGIITTTTTEAPTTTSTTAPSGVDLGSGSSQPPAGAKDAGGDGTKPPPGGIVVPPEAQKIINSVKRTRPNNNAELLTAVAQLVTLGMTQEEAYRVGLGRFPVAGAAHYSHDWLYPRYGPGFRFHLGTDVFAAAGTPLRAPVDGVAVSKTDSLGGLTVKVIMPDKTYFYLAHLSALVEGFTQNMPVRTGDIVGYVGDSGNAKGGAPHVHVGVYPRGGVPIDPKPVLDQFLKDALAHLPDVIAAYTAAHTQAPVAAAPAPDPATDLHLLRPTLATAALHSLTSGGDGLTPTTLYLLANDPVGGGRRVLQGVLDDLAAGIDWSDR